MGVGKFRANSSIFCSNSWRIIGDGISPGLTTAQGLSFSPMSSSFFYRFARLSRWFLQKIRAMTQTAFIND